MDFLSALRLLARRWYVVVLGLIATALLTAAVVVAVSPHYTATGTLVVLNPKSPDAVIDKFNTGDLPSNQGVVKNPITAISGDLQNIAEIISTKVDSQAVRDRLKAEGATAPFKIGIDAATRSPFIKIAVDGTNRAETINTLALVIKGTADELDNLQSKELNAEPDAHVVLRVISAPARPDRAIGSKLRAGIAVGAMMLMISVGLGFLAEAMVVARQRRQRGRQASYPTSTGAPVAPAAPVVPAPIASAAGGSAARIPTATNPALAPTALSPRASGVPTARPPRRDLDLPPVRSEVDPDVTSERSRRVSQLASGRAADEVTPPESRPAASSTSRMKTASSSSGASNKKAKSPSADNAVSDHRQPNSPRPMTDARLRETSSRDRASNTSTESPSKSAGNSADDGADRDTAREVTIDLDREERAGRITTASNQSGSNQSGSSNNPGSRDSGWTLDDDVDDDAVINTDREADRVANGKTRRPVRRPSSSR